MIGGKADTIGIVTPENRRMNTLDATRDQHDRQAVIFRKLDVFRRRADSGRHNDPIRAELQKRIHEGALFFELIVMVGQDEGLPRPVQFRFDGFENFREERIHDVMHHDADNAGA